LITKPNLRHTTETFSIPTDTKKDPRTEAEENYNYFPATADIRMAIANLNSIQTNKVINKMVRTTVRNYKTMLSATMDLTIEEVTSAVNERCDQLQAEQSQRTATMVADFIQPDHTMGEQLTLAEEQRQWLFTQVINILSID
jgi:hypothetical protein